MPEALKPRVLLVAIVLFAYLCSHTGPVRGVTLTEKYCLKI